LDICGSKGPRLKSNVRKKKLPSNDGKQVYN